MKLEQYFKQFEGKISLDPTRVNRIVSAVRTWENLLKEDEEIKKIFNDFFVQGSFAVSTAIRPQNDQEFDVDAVLLLDLDDSMEPRELIDFIADRMKMNEKYKDNIKKKDRCIRVDYSGDFHIDIVPAKNIDEEWILIPSKKEDEWVETNPAGFIEWCKDIEAESGNKFSTVTKILKYWRDTKVGKDTAPKSILLTTLIGGNIDYKNSVAESLVLTLEELIQNLDNYVVNGEPYVENPSLAGENLARDWNLENFEIFKKKLKKLHKDAKDALDEKDKDESINKWRKIFGSCFPAELSEAANLNNHVRNGLVFVAPDGHLNSCHGKKVEEHRFYGC